MKKFNLILFFVQIFLTTWIIYFGLTYNVEYAWESVVYSYFSSYEEENEQSNSEVQSESKDFVEDKNDSDLVFLANRSNELVNEAINEIFNQMHWAWSTSQDDSLYQKKFQDICFINLNTCMKIRFKWEFNYKDKYIYLASIIKTVSFIDQNSKFENSVASVLEEITITLDQGKRRWHSTRNEITINAWWLTSYAEFLEVFTHEIGHIVDLWIIKWVDSVFDASFTEFGKVVFAQDDDSLRFYDYSFESEKDRKSDITRKDFVSWYGMSDPFEDFAESFNAYMNHNSYFKYLAKNNDILKKKYNFIANYFGGKFLYSNDSDLINVNKNIVRRPYDTTKLR